MTRSLAAALALAVAATAPPAGFVQPRDAQGRFTNLDGSGPKGMKDFLKWNVVDRLTGNRRRTPDRAPLPFVEADAARLATPPAPGAGIRLTFLGHAGWLLQQDGVSLLLDPVFSSRIGGFVGRNLPPGLTAAQLPRIDAVLVSHNHYDHLDVPTLKQVRAPVIAGLGVDRLLESEGLPNRTLGWWQSTPVGGVRVTFVPAQHWSRRSLGDTNRTLWGGFVVEGPSGRVYHSGDSGWFDGFAEIGRRFPALDVALLPIGCYDPRWFMSPQHMDPEEAVRAFEALGARRMIGMHFGTFKLTDEPLDEPPARLEAERVRRGHPKDRVGTIAVGETIDVARP